MLNHPNFDGFKDEFKLLFMMPAHQFAYDYDLDLNNIVTAIQGLRIEENLTNEKEYRRLTISQEDLALNFRGVTRQLIYK